MKGAAQQESIINNNIYQVFKPTVISAHEYLQQKEWRWHKWDLLINDLFKSLKIHGQVLY